MLLKAKSSLNYGTPCIGL